MYMDTWWFHRSPIQLWLQNHICHIFIASNLPRNLNFVSKWPMRSWTAVKETNQSTISHYVFICISFQNDVLYLDSRCFFIATTYGIMLKHRVFGNKIRLSPLWITRHQPKSESMISGRKLCLELEYHLIQSDSVSFQFWFMDWVFIIIYIIYITFIMSTSLLLLSCF